MIRHLQHKEIDFRKWDACIAASLNGSIYALSWYLDIVSVGWEALILDDYKAVMPLTKRKKYFFNYLFQPPFTQQLGIFFTEEKFNLSDDFICALPSTFKLIEIQLNEKNTIAENKTLEINKKLTHHLQLNAKAEWIQEHYSENLKRNLKKFRKSGLSITDTIKDEELIKLFRAHRGRTIETMNEKEYIILRTLLAKCREAKLVISKGVLGADGKLIAGAWFIESYSSYIFLFSAVNEEAKTHSVMSGIIDSFINQHIGDKKVLDFEGSMNPELARFYKGFGSKEIVYLQIRKNTLPAFIRRFKK